MSAKQKNEVVAPTVGRETLEETPQRTLKFLRGIGTSLPIRSALAAKGYEEADHQEGWSLLHGASGYVGAGPFNAIDVEVRDAIASIDAWDEDGFRIVRASLGRRYPAVAEQVLEGIGPQVGAAAVVGVSTLLDRLDELEKSKNKDAKPALALLEKRGIDKAERMRLRGLVEKAESVTPVVGEDAAKNELARQKAEAKHVEALGALRAWYEEWSDIARATIKRRDHLILLGLASRKPPTRKAKKPAAGSGETPAAKNATAS